jgi:phosphate transport system substrate-binding protein
MKVNKLKNKLKNKLVWVGILALGLSGFTSLCAAGELDVFAGENQVLRISGGTAHIPVMKAAARKIMTFNPRIQITIAGGGSGAGIKQVGEGLVDIGNSGRQATEGEVNKYGLKMYKWAIDGVAAVTNPKNPVKALSTQQLQDIFSGEIISWKELGGEDKSINVYTRDTASGTRSVFWKKALKKSDITVKANVVVSNGAMKTAVNNDPYSIGYVSVGFIDAGVAPLSLDGISPTMDAVKSGQYKVARGLFSNTKGEAKGLAKKFIDYLMGPDGQAMAAAKGFISVN